MTYKYIREVDLISKSVQELLGVNFKKLNQEPFIGDLRSHSVSGHCRVRVEFRVVLHLLDTLLEVTNELLPFSSDADGHRDVETRGVLDRTQDPAEFLHHRFQRNWVNPVFLTVAHDRDDAAVVVGSVGQLGNFTPNSALDLNTSLHDELCVLDVTLLADFHHCGPSGRDHITWTAASERCRGIEATIPARRAEKLVLAPLRSTEKQARDTFGPHAVLMRVATDRGHTRHSKVKNVRCFETSLIEERHDETSKAAVIVATDVQFRSKSSDLRQRVIGAVRVVRAAGNKANRV